MVDAAVVDNYPWDNLIGSQRELFVGARGVVSYQQFFQLVDEWKKLLSTSGVKPEEKIAVIGDFSALGTSLVLALLSNRNIIIPFSYESIIEIDSALSTSGCDWLIKIDKLKLLSDQIIEQRSIHQDNSLFQQLTKSGHAGLVLFSSGTSGKPKAILHDLNRVVQRFKPNAKRFRSIPMLMFDHFGGFNTIFGMLSSESTVVEVDTRTAENICSTIQEFKVTLLPTTPSFLSLIIMSNAHKRFDLSSLTRITYGTEPINVHLLERINKVFPNAILQQTYGLSEVGVLASRSESNESTRLELGGSGFETKVVDGILWIKSEFAMLGYLSTEGANDFVDGWFNTKDQVIQDGKYFKFVGRDSDQINVGGQKVLPIEVEEEIMLLNEVLDVQVFGEKHLLLGQIVVANVVLASGVESEGIKLKIRKHCQERLTKYKVPQKIFFVSQIEVSSRGKRVKGVSSETGKE